MSEELKACSHCGQNYFMERDNGKFIACADPDCCAYNLWFERDQWNLRPLEDALTAENKRLREALEKLANAKIVYDSRENHEDLKLPDNTICICPDGVIRLAQEVLNDHS